MNYSCYVSFKDSLWNILQELVIEFEFRCQNSRVMTEKQFTYA